MTSIAIALHVGAGAFWVVSSLAIAVTRRAAKWLLAVQMGAVSVVVVAGIYLWHALHAGRQGPTEHLLTLGTLSAFIGLGLQIGVAPVLLAGKLGQGGLVLYRLSALLLCVAAAAMVASRLG